MASLGFKECITQPGIYYHRERNIKVVSHVDDFLCVGAEEDLIWFREALGKKYEIKSKMLSQTNPEVTFLGRKIIWCADGPEIEADSKHVRVLLEEWGLTECNPCDTPIGSEAAEVNQKEEMPSGEATLSVSYTHLTLPTNREV